MSNNFIIGVFSDESLLLQALKKLKSNKIKINNIYGPFADHKVLRELTPESRLPYLSLLIGIFTLIGAFAAIYYITVIDYPLNFGGKPIFSFPPMVVVLFLLTILVTGGVSTLAFLGIARLYPGKNILLELPGSLNDRFYLVVEKKQNDDEVKAWLNESGAEEIINRKIEK